MSNTLNGIITIKHYYLKYAYCQFSFKVKIQRSIKQYKNG